MQVATCGAEFMLRDQRNAKENVLGVQQETSGRQFFRLSLDELRYASSSCKQDTFRKPIMRVAEAEVWAHTC